MFIVLNIAKLIGQHFCIAYFKIRNILVNMTLELYAT